MRICRTTIIKTCRKLTADAICLVLAAGFISLSGCDMVDRPFAPDHIRIRMSGEPSTLHPILASDAPASEVGGFLFDRLIDMDPDTMEYRPMIALKWDIAPDHKTYTFYMRDDVKWHDGKPVTADDVVFSFNYIMDPKTKAPHLKVYYKDIKKVQKIDAHTVQFVYNEIYFKGFSFCGGMPILPKHILQNETDPDHSAFSRAPVGNGPYKFVTWESGKRIRLERNENYWGPKPAIQKLDFMIIPDPAVGLQILKKGLLDYYELRTIQWVKQTGSKKFLKQFYKLTYSGQVYSYIGWNLKNPIFSDKRVRQAMTMSINRELIRDKYQFGLAKIMTGPFFPGGPQNNPEIAPLPFDPIKARELLGAAGWKDTNGDGILDKNGQKFSFEFLYSSGSTFAERLGTFMKEDLKKMGIEMRIVRLEWAVFLDRIGKKEFDAVMLAWLSPPESDPYQIWHSSQVLAAGSSNFISFANLEADRLMERARREFDEESRNKLYHRFHAILYEEQPYTFLFISPTMVAVSHRFDNVIVHKLGLDLREWKVMAP